MPIHTSTYWKHVVTVLGGAVGAQALPLLAAPLITRLCSPAEMGAFMVWVGVVTVVAIGATLRLETALILDHDESDQATGFRVVAWSATLVALGLTAAALAARALGVPAAMRLSWTALATLGLGAWLTACMQTTLAYATSRSAFAHAARAKVLGAGSIALLQLLLLATGAGALALLAGHLGGLALGLAAALTLLRPPLARPALRLDGAMRRYLQRHRGFWRYSLPSNLLNVLVGQLPLFIIGARYGALAAGLFALTQRVLSAPIALLAASVLEVFKRQSVLDFEAHGHCRDAYRYTFKTLVWLGIGPSLVLLLCSPWLFATVFGAQWRAAGEMAQILAPLYFLNFIASPLSYVFFVSGRQKTDLLWQVVLFCMTVAVFAFAGTLRQSLAWYAGGYSLLYLVYLRMSWQCAQSRAALP